MLGFREAWIGVGVADDCRVGNGGRWDEFMEESLKGRVIQGKELWAGQAAVNCCLLPPVMVRCQVFCAGPSKSRGWIPLCFLRACMGSPCLPTPPSYEVQAAQHTNHDHRDHLSGLGACSSRLEVSCVRAQTCPAVPLLGAAQCRFSVFEVPFC